MLRIITTVALAALATACATPEEAARWEDESLGTHEATLEEMQMAEREAAPAERAVVDDGDDGEVHARRVPVRVEKSRDRIHVDYNDGSEQDYCYNQETGTYQSCP